MLKSFLREKFTTSLLIVGLILSFFVSTNVISMLNMIKEKQNLQNAFSYKLEYNIVAYIEVVGEEIQDKNYADNLDDLLDGLKRKHGNLFLYGNYSWIGNSMSNPVLYIAIERTEEIEKKFLWGDSPTENEIENQESVAIVGNNLEKYLHKKDNDFHIIVDNIEYKATGVYENNFSNDTNTEMDLCIDYNCLNEKTKEYIKNNFAVLQFKYASSYLTKKEMENDLIEMEHILEENGYQNVEITAVDRTNQLADAKTRFNVIFMCVVFCFTLVNSMMLSNIWIKRRYQEMVIRRTYGFSQGDLFLLLVKDLLKYMLFSLAIGVILQSIYAICLHQSHIQLKYVGDNLIYLLVIMLIVLMVNVIVPVHQVGKIIPAQQIRKQKR